MAIYVLHTTSTYDGSERRDSWDTPADANRAVAKAEGMGKSLITAYVWIGPVEAVCGRCGQELELSMGEWRNPMGFPACQTRAGKSRTGSRTRAIPRAGSACSTAACGTRRPWRCRARSACPCRCAVHAR